MNILLQKNVQEAAEVLQRQVKDVSRQERQGEGRIIIEIKGGLER